MSQIFLVHSIVLPAFTAFQGAQRFFKSRSFYHFPKLHLQNLKGLSMCLINTWYFPSEFWFKRVVCSLYYLILNTCEVNITSVILQTENRVWEGVSIPVWVPGPISDNGLQIQSRILCLHNLPCLGLTIPTQLHCFLCLSCPATRPLCSFARPDASKQMLDATGLRFWTV